jgi:hypothetical protein
MEFTQEKIDELKAQFRPCPFCNKPVTVHAWPGNGQASITHDKCHVLQGRVVTHLMTIDTLLRLWNNGKGEF